MLGPDSPLGQAIQTILKDQSNGLTPEDLELQLRQRGFQSSIASIRKVLGHTEVFTQLGKEHFALRSLVESEAVLIQVPSRAASSQPGSKYAALPVGSLPLSAASYVVVDVETTGLDYRTGLIYQIAALKIIDGKPAPAQPTFARYVDIGRDLPLVIKRKMNVKDDALLGAPDLTKVLGELVDFSGHLPLVAHNARFDLGFIRYSLVEHLGYDDLLNPVLDTLELALMVYPGLRSYRLEALREQFLPRDLDEQPFFQEVLVNFGAGGRSYHDARYDVVVTWLLFDRLCESLNSMSPDILAEWLRWLPREEYPLSNLIRPATKPASAAIGFESWLGNSATIEIPERSTGNWSPEQVVGYFSRTGRLGKTMGAQYEERPEQVEMVRHACDAFGRRRFKMIEAATGTGKSDPARVAISLPSGL